MFGKRVIRLGDPTSHGGTVVSATDHFVMFDKPVARIGDKATCPIPGHGVCTIVEGDPSWTIDGRNVALEGHKTSCGATLISTLPNVLRSYDGLGTASRISNLSPAFGQAKAFANPPAEANDEKDFEYFFVAKRGDGSAVRLAYRIDSGPTKLHEGVLNTDGSTPAFPMSSEGDITLWIPQP